MNIGKINIPCKVPCYQGINRRTHRKIGNREFKGEFDENHILWGAPNQKAQKSPQVAGQKA